MVAAGAPSSSPIKKASGSIDAKQAPSARPGFQPSAAAQFTAIEISSGRMVRMVRSVMAGDRMDGLMNPNYRECAPSKRTIHLGRVFNEIGSDKCLPWRDILVFGWHK